MMKKIALALCAVSVLMMTATAHAASRTAAGLWVTTADNQSYWLRIQATSADPTRLVEDLTGLFKTSSIGVASEDAELPVTGQFLTRTGIVVLNIGGPSSSRLYAIGDTRAEGRHMHLRMFTVRRGHGVNFEKELYFDPKTEPAPPSTSKP